MAFREVCQDCTTPAQCGSEWRCCKNRPNPPTCERCGFVHEPRAACPGREPQPRRVNVTRSRDKVGRLRERIAQARAANPDDPVPGILGGIMDLLEEMTQ